MRTDPKSIPVTVLALMMFLVPALGVPSELMLQDTLKSAIAAFGILIAALVFFWQQRNRTEPLLWHGLVWLPLALMAYALGSMVWSHTYLAGVEAIRWFLLALLLWLGLNTLTKDNIPTLLWGIHGGAVVASMWVALQFWFDLQWFPQAAAPASTFINRNFFAEYAVSVLPLSIWLLTTMVPKGRLLAMAASIVLCVLAILMTGTRSALVAMVVITPVLAFIAVRYRNAPGIFPWTRAQWAGVASVFVLGIAGLGLIPTGNPTIGSGATPLGVGINRTASIAKPSEYTTGSFSVRSVIWKATARMVMAQPLTGVGAGAWEVHIPLYQTTETTSETEYYAHNEYLQLLSEYGLLLGGLVLAFLFAYLLKTASSTWRVTAVDCREDVLIRAFILCSLLVLLLVSNAGFPWHLAAVGALLALLLATLASSDFRLKLHEPFLANTLTYSPRLRKLTIAAICICLVVSSYLTQQAAEAERKLVRSLQFVTRLAITSRGNAAAWAAQNGPSLADIRDSIRITPHNRKLTGMLADILGVWGDWTTTVTLLESIIVSRPHISSAWANLATGYAELGLHDRAQMVLLEVQRLKPAAADTKTLELKLMSLSGRHAQAALELSALLDQGNFDYNRIQTAYAMGYRAADWGLTLRALELRNQTWPQQATDGYFRLGRLYAECLNDDKRALDSFRKGWATASSPEKENYRNQVPEPYRSQM